MFVTFNAISTGRLRKECNMSQSQLTLVKTAFRERKWKKLFICLGLCAALAAIGDLVDRSTNALEEIGVRDRLVQINQGLSKELGSVNTFNLAKVFYARLVDSSYGEDESAIAGFILPNQTDLVEKPNPGELSLGSDPTSLSSPMSGSTDPFSVLSRHQYVTIPSPEENDNPSWLDRIIRLEPPPTNIVFGILRIPWALAYTIQTEWRDGLIGKSLTLLTVLLFVLFLNSLSSEAPTDLWGSLLTLALIPLIVSLLASAVVFVVWLMNAMFGELLLLTSFTVFIVPIEVIVFLICGAGKEFIHKSLDDWRDGVMEKAE
jgi:hypothetical protein